MNPLKNNTRSYCSNLDQLSSSYKNLKPGIGWKLIIFMGIKHNKANEWSTFKAFTKMLVATPGIQNMITIHYETKFTTGTTNG